MCRRSVAFSMPQLIFLGCCLMVSSVSAASRSPDGCDILRHRAFEICKAKVSCAREQAAIAAMTPLIQRCTSGQSVPSHNQVRQALSRFTNDLYFQCCLGNALIPHLSPPFTK